MKVRRKCSLQSEDQLQRKVKAVPPPVSSHLHHSLPESKPPSSMPDQAGPYGLFLEVQRKSIGILKIENLFNVIYISEGHLPHCRKLSEDKWK